MIKSPWILPTIRNVSNKIQREKSNNILKYFFSLKSWRLWDTVGKYGTASQAIYDNIIRRMRIPRWLTKATSTHSESVTFIAFPSNNSYAKAPQW